MPRTIHIIGYRKDGKSELVLGPETPIEQVRLSEIHWRNSGQLPEGFSKLEVFDSDAGKTKTLLPFVAPTPSPDPVKQILPKPDVKRKGNKIEPL